ncbi:IpaC/SipC family type III secretion system effector [Providencia rustigianii]|uniref:IpaC/SipC family type III secretion system effector n=1 Tax=Providencia rustigianii TaxID=158850 RepID=UPI000D9E884E|nr:IpaC/SipC family type III secretion system effector [Providencia rustigianii]SPY76089.1 type III secretion target, IpaC/SipC family [Providencia rustigianii]
MTTVTQSLFSPVLSKPVGQTNAQASTPSTAAENTPKSVTISDITANAAEISGERVALKIPSGTVNAEALTNALDQLDSPEKALLLNDLRTFISLTPDMVETTLTKVVNESTELTAKNMLLDDEAVIKQFSQAIYVILAGSFFKDVLNNQGVTGVSSKETKSVQAVKNSEFVGIISSDLIVELMKIIRKVVAELNISDRRISADFLMLNAKMVESAAESTIKEGKEMFAGALTGFFTSLAISTAGAAFQARSLHKQTQSIKNNLVKANQNGAAADRLNELNAGSLSSANGLKGNNLSLKTKDGVDVDMVDSATPAQKVLANQRGTEAAQRTNKLGLAERDEHERIMNKTRVHMGVAEQGSRLSDNAGQMATSANQVNVKSEEANKMTQQSVADMARSVSADKDKQVDKNSDLVKEMRKSVNEIKEEQQRTFQSIVRG